jgi:hypothetical protein
MTTFTVEDWELVAAHQTVSLNFLREHTPQPAMDRCLIAAFLRAISGGLDWPQEDVDLVAEQLDWFTLSNRTLTDAEVSAVITKYPQHVHWYFFLKNNALTEAQIEQVSATKRIGAIEWWVLLTVKRPENMKFSENFVCKHKNRKNWWKFIHPDNQKTFFQQCLESLYPAGSAPSTGPSNGGQKDQLAIFLNEFVKEGDWNTILRHEELEEWFIRLFGHFSDRIPMYWWKICRYQKLPMSFIKSSLEKLDMNVVLAYQQLTPEFLEEYAPFFETDAWDKVAKYQPLTAAFVDMHASNLNPTMLKQNTHLAPLFANGTLAIESH